MPSLHALMWPRSPTLLLIALMTVGCSTLPDRVPDSQVRMDLSSARLAIESADQAGAQDKAAVDLFRANAKLARAREALRTGDRVWARRLAQEADIDARVAQARAEAETQRQEAVAMQLATETLRGSRVLHRSIQEPTEVNHD
jgi:Domain of unknown function (DUF4398)